MKKSPVESLLLLLLFCLLILLPRIVLPAGGSCSGADCSTVFTMCLTTTDGSGGSCR